MTQSGHGELRHKLMSNEVDKCLLLALSGHRNALSCGPLLGAKRTSVKLSEMSAYDAKRTLPITRRREFVGLIQQLEQSATGRCAKLRVAEAAIIIRIGCLEPLFDDGEVFVFAYRAVLIGVRSPKLPCAQSAA
jgi:hypothetical protein